MKDQAGRSGLVLEEADQSYSCRNGGNHVDLNDVALFVQVVRAGSFAEAGRRLGMPPSTASRRVQLLEAALGTRLMQRTTRRLMLTDAGTNFYAESADQIDALLRVAGQVTNDSAEIAGRVRVAAPVDFFNWFPAQAVAQFIAEHPRVRLEFELNDARIDLLGEGIDVAMRGGDRDPSLFARKLGTSYQTLVASPGYLAAHGVPAEPGDLSGHQCITSPSHSGPRTTWRLGGVDHQAATIEVDGPFQANTSSAQLEAALAGMGIALLPIALSAAHIDAGRLKEVLPDYTSGAIGVHLVYHSRQLPRAVSAFIEFAANTIKEMGLMDSGKRSTSSPLK
ncbi:MULTISPECIES: LysR family transcriptional regulator [unclassified Pseudomonas]|uniref:LysR family transcriptional regulator n=1 Tax=unclassified Pseudomonas TaxID=196821 RepID=UPI000D375E12|nr:MULTISPECIES: LysR family transcriptional regulator [unclassified Pseudomonas]RAU48152.1 LysR family transcriptional regulator [Pseudomonas sp. RIT 409]RAU55546.1 LysR family transcriptional regulator [Pseudomonas sp. RIT 412]